MKKDVIVSIRLATELDKRLQKAAEALDLSKNDIARHAIRAAVRSIEESKYKIAWPIDMALAQAEKNDPFLKMVHKLNPDEVTFASQIRREKRADKKRLRDEFKKRNRLAEGTPFKKIKPE